MIDMFTTLWIGQNLDLLTEEELKPYKKYIIQWQSKSKIQSQIPIIFSLTPNIIIGAYLSNNKEDNDCLDYLFKIGDRGVKLFISSLSLAQFISMSQKKKALKRSALKSKIDYLSSKCTIMFLWPDISSTLN